MVNNSIMHKAVFAHEGGTFSQIRGGAGAIGPGCDSKEMPSIKPTFYWR